MDYGSILKGDIKTIDAGGKFGDKVVSCTKVEFEGKSIYISDKIFETTENIMNIIDPYLTNALDVIGRGHGELPDFVIADFSELTDANGRYLYESNTVVLMPKLFGNMDENDEYNKHLIFHELLHWSDCQDMAKIYPGLNEDDLVDHVIEWAKDKLDNLGENKYSMINISSYAKKQYDLGRFDEAYVEYRVKKIMEN